MISYSQLEMTDCFICGAENAKWPISSKPSNTGGKPFFPFLAHHKPPSESTKRDGDTNFITCNVCYSFLIQQWNAYEDSDTPLSKRLYWLKHQSEQESLLICDDSSLYENQNNMSDDEKLSLYERGDVGDGRNSSSQQESYSNDAVMYQESDSFLRETIQKFEYGQKDQPDQDTKPCIICRKENTLQAMKTVHTKPQIKKDTPYFPTLHDVYHNTGEQVDSLGRLLSCEECHKMLILQWKVYSSKGTPVSERRYIFGQGLAKCFVCFICGNFEKTEPKLLKSKRNIDMEPYFPFLKNLKKPVGAEPINEDDTVKCCVKCTSVLFKQLYDYEAASVPVFDQLYSVIGRKECQKSPITQIHAPLPSETELICLICQRRKVRKEMKEVYSNPYANMDLSFLDEIQRIPGTYFARNLGQTLVCSSCYISLTYQWEKFDTEDVPLNAREYNLHRYNDGACEETKCQLCHTCIKVKEAFDIDFVPHHGESNHPFFPCLAKLKSSQDGSKSSIKSCVFCFKNLILQWNHFERESTSNDDRWKRNYKPYHFVCYSCGNTVYSSNISLVKRNLLKNMSHQRSVLAVELNENVVLCMNCKESVDAELENRCIKFSEGTMEKKKKIKNAETSDSPVSSETEKTNRNSAETSARNQSPPASLKDSKDNIGMKVTAAVPPLPSLVQRNQDTSSMQSQSSGSRNDDEGSFAAALRKLAQQAIVPAARRPVPRERQASPSSSFKSVLPSREGTKSPPRGNNSGHKSHSPFYPRGSIHHASINPSSSNASVAPPSSTYDKEKPEIHGGLPSDDISSRRVSRPVVPGIFGRHNSTENAFRQNRDEGVMHHGEKSSARDPAEAGSRSHTASGIMNGQNTGQLNILGVKDRGSNIGLVHPQPVRKLPDDDAVKSGLINSVRCNPIESPASLFRPPSPSDNFTRYQMVHGIHQHSGQGPCPVHGHESGHHHGSPRDHGNRPGRLPFEGITPRSGPLPDFRGIHPHHQRMREDIYGMNRIPVERREGLPNHILEDDMRRRGYDWPWQVQHPFYENEQYRRRLVNGYRSGEHAYKDMVHGPHYFSPHLYYPPDYSHVDPYTHPSISHSDMYPSRYGSNQLSPRLAEYYRRERSLSDRGSERSDSRRQDSTGLKPDGVDNERRVGENFVNDTQILEERNARRREMADYFSSLSRDRLNGRDDRRERLPVDSISGSIHKRSSIDGEEPKRKLRIMEKLDLIAKPCDERGPQVNDIVVKKEPNTEHETSFSAESVANDELQHNRSDVYTADSENSTTEMTPEDIEKKADFMSSIGLITHGKKRVLEEDYERKRWERKVAKMRSRPRKRGRREQTDDSDGRPCSELDFYNGPMTRHKQQLLQEQEMLLEQVQKNHLERNGMKDGCSLDNKTFSSSNSSSPTNSSVTSATPNSISEPTLPSSTSNRRTDEDRPSLSNSQSFKPYKDREGRRDFVNPIRSYSKGEDSHATTRDSQELDNYVFGLPQMDISASKQHWAGIENVARSYFKYENEREIKENMMRNTSDKLKYEREKFNQQRQQHQKDISMLREKKGLLNESVRRQQQIIKNLHMALNKIAST